MEKVTEVAYFHIRKYNFLYNYPLKTYHYHLRSYSYLEYSKIVSSFSTKRHKKLMDQSDKVTIKWYKFDNPNPLTHGFQIPQFDTDIIFGYELDVLNLSFCYLIYTKTNETEADRVRDKIYGNYLCIDLMLFESISIFINYDWLHKQVKAPKLTQELFLSIEKVLNRWENNNSRTLFINTYSLNKYKKNIYGILLIKAFLYDFLYHFIEEIEVEIQVRDNSLLKNNEFNKIKYVAENVIKNINLPTPSIQELAMSSGMSISKFKLLFKEIYGVGPHQYFLDQKLVYAHALFKSGKYNFTQIAYKIGYNHTSSFTRIYKKKYYENSDDS